MPATQHIPSPSRCKAVAACLLVMVLVMAGCVAPPAAGTGPASVDRAELLLRQDNPAAAAQMYEQLAAGNPPPLRNDLALSAARAWLSANRADDAQRVLDAHGAGLAPSQQFERDLLRGEVAIARGQYAPAWQQVSKIEAPLKPADAARLYLLQQQVALRASQPVEAVRAGIERDRVASSDSERNRARRDLLDDLRGALDRGMRIDTQSSRDAVVNGWLEIAQIAAAAARAPMGAAAAVEGWRRRFPNHPAATIAASEIVAPAERGAPRSAPVAAVALGLLLPLSGPNAVPAGLIRDGFMAGVARMPDGNRPTVKVYDTGALPVGTALQNARADGAGFIVGPLTRDELRTALEQRPGNMPMLLLNTLPGSGFAGANIYQYGLAPEDEARQIARHIAGAGQRNALVLAPSNDWGNRVAAAFADELTRAGGQVVVQGRYERGISDLTDRVETALGVTESKNRHSRMQTITGMELGFEARPRPDIDAIFVAGYQPDPGTLNPLMLINPVLNRRARGIPVFITQDSLSTEASANRELLDMYLLDMPWILEASGPAADLRAATESAWSARGTRQSRFFAFGFDAANLALAVRGPASAWPIDGLTGRLNLTPDGRVERSLQWARIGAGGVVQAADPATQ